MTTRAELDELIEAVLYRLTWRHPHWPADIRHEIEHAAHTLYLTEDLDIYRALAR